MKNTIFAALICTTSLTLPALAADPATEVKPAAPAAAKSTNDIALAGVADLKGVIAAAASADSLENAKKAATTINALAAKFEAHTAALKDAKEPTLVEKTAMASAMVDSEEQMEAQMQKMMANMIAGGEEVAQALQGAMATFQEKSAPFMAKLEALYPNAEMEPLVEAEKAKRAKAKEAPAEKK